MAERISLAEAYNNKDVVTQIAILKDKLDSIPDADLTNVVLKTGDQIIDGEKTFNDPIVANGGVVFANSGIHVNGTLEVDGDIIQNGSAYETHAEQVFSKNDLIVTREDAIGSLAAGQLSGIRVHNYDGVSDLNLGVDAAGVMRVGDVGDEQPLMTRDEAADLNGGDVLLWDSVDQKAIGQAKDTVPTQNSSAVVTSDGIFTALSDKMSVRRGEKFIQSGISGNVGGSVTFPVPFSTTALVVISVRAGDNNLWVSQVKSVSKTGFTFEARYSANGTSWAIENNVVITWIAIGD